MSDRCYAMIRGSGIRLTDLDMAGRYDPENVRFATSKSIAIIALDEVSDGGGNELLRNDEDEPRIHIVQAAETVRYDADINFLRCDPSILNLLTGIPLAYNAAGDVVGFDARTRLPLKAFALEVWSKLAGMRCEVGTVSLGFGEAPFGMFPFGSGEPVDDTGGALSQAYGYTLFPFLKGGTIGGFTFAKGLVSFNVKGARTQRGSHWGFGPYDIGGPAIRLPNAVSRNTLWKTFVTSGAPPAEAAGVSSFVDGP